MDSHTSSADRSLLQAHQRRASSDPAIQEVDLDEELEERPELTRSNSALSMSFIDLSKLLLVPEFDFGYGFDQVSGSTKKKFNDMKKLTQNQLRRFKSGDLHGTKPGSGTKPKKFLAQDLAKFQDSLNRRFNKVDGLVQESLQSSATQKAFYAFAVGLIAAAGYVIGRYPTYFPVFHTVLFGLLMPIRFYTYFKRGYQYFLADLCYYVNVLLLLFLWVFPQSKSLFISVFSLSLGTLCFAVITWRNSLVLHSIEKTTSSIIHIMPPLTMFVLVHKTPKDYLAIRYPAISEIHSWNFVYGIISTCIYYTIWQIAYHYFITVKRRDQIAKGRVTSFTFMKKKQSNSMLGKFVISLPKIWMQVAAFTLIQFMYQILTMLLCPIWFQYKYACAVFVGFIFLWSAYNGANYYIEVFGKRFEKEVKHLKEEVNALQQQLDRSASTSDRPSPVLNASAQLSDIPSADLQVLQD